MNKGQWGRIIAAVAAIVIIALVVVYLFAGHTKSEATTSAAPRVASRNQAAASGSESTVSNAGNGSGSTSSNTGAASSPKSTTSPATTGTASATTSAGGKSTQAPAGGESKAALQKEAESYVKQLTQSSKEPLKVGNAEGFVKGSRPLELKQAGSGTSTNAGAAATEAKESEPPAAGESGQTASLGATAAAESREEKAPGTTTAAEPRQAASPAAALAGSSAPQAANSAAAGESSEVKSEQAVSSAGAPASASSENDVKSAQQVSVDLPVNEQASVTIADIIGAGADVPPDAVYYVHTVKSKDDQGIWGIVQSGVVENFAEGVAVRHGGKSNTYRVDIPHDADELRPDHSSSFLGRLIYEKSKESYVYNFKTGRIGKNPNLIKPGQEIVIVSFTPEELIEIYKHFVYQQELGQGAAHY